MSAGGAVDAPTACLRCDGALEPGFLVDHGDLHVRLQASWASGEPRRSRWQASAIGRGERHLAVTTFRCTRCGRLESYAPAPAP